MHIYTRYIYIIYIIYILYNIYILYYIYTVDTIIPVRRTYVFEAINFGDSFQVILT